MSSAASVSPEARPPGEQPAPAGGFGPLAAVLSRRPDDGVVGPGGESAEATPPAAPPGGHPAQRLGALLDMPGSLRLDAFLERPLPPLTTPSTAPSTTPTTTPSAAPSEDASEQAEALRCELAERLDRLRDAADKIFEQCACGPTRLPDAAAIAGQLEGLRGARAAQQRGAAEQWAGSFHATLAAGIARVRTEALYARRQLARDLPKLGARAGRIEELDRILVAATRSASDALFARIGPRLAHDFQSGLANAMRRFEAERRAAERTAPADPGTADEPPTTATATATAWLAPDGWIGAHLCAARQWLEAVTEHEARALEDLLEAALAAERGERLGSSHEPDDSQQPAATPVPPRTKEQWT